MIRTLLRRTAVPVEAVCISRGGGCLSYTGLARVFKMLARIWPPAPGGIIQKKSHPGTAAALPKGFDPIRFGVSAGLAVEPGVIAPRVGGNLFMVKGAPGDLSLTDILAGAVPFMPTGGNRQGNVLALLAISLLRTGQLRDL